jgi:hypothetical protein
MNMRSKDSGTKLSRRALLRVAAGSAAYAALPALAQPSATRLATRPPASVGYWRGGALANPAHVRAGWLEWCGSSRMQRCETPLDDEIADASRIAGSPGVYRMRVIAAANARQLQPLRLVAVYGHDARHELWSTWRGPSGIECSPPVASRVASRAGAPFALEIIARDEAVPVALPALQGTYVLGLGASPLRWRNASLVARDATLPFARELVHRASGAPVASPYLLLSVERLG